MWNWVKTINLGCHGIPERCLTIKGKRMRICARCFGSNIGHILAIILFIVRQLPPWYYSIACMSIMLIDWSFQTFFKIMSNNARRLITGIIGGFGIGCLIWEGIAKVISFL
jgi:uncharacterized membrane protein